MLPLVAPSAVIELSFDPILEVGGVVVRLETIGVAVAILVALVVAALVARHTPLDLTRPSGAPGPGPDELNHLRRDDLLYIAVAAVPGAVIGGRLGYALVHLDYYRSDMAALLDIGSGGLQLSLGIVGGFLTASIVAALLGAPLGRWMHALALPVLLVLAGGKVAMVLGGSGQGQPSGAPWATAYLGPGPWGSLAPAMPAHPAQAYEALATALVILVAMGFVAFDAFKGRNGGALLFGIGLWAVARALVAMTWRDPAVVGPLRMDQVISIVIAGISFGLMLTIGTVSTARGRRAGQATPGAAGGSPTPGAPSATPERSTGDGGIEWPDPATRPRI
ncbi:MAG TPA: prolipoprotein diacylglyceryl transferase family protein [Candidatus Limnocylindrales bacterium]|nr:prolipoprotein diacylglyceryl transferase family protein [Candidatus Limnocylindrales bacterium]